MHFQLRAPQRTRAEHEKIAAGPATPWLRRHFDNLGLAGRVSVIGGVAYLSAAARANPRLGLLAIYVATGEVEFIIQAWLLGRRHRRSYIVLA
jgi:hypothetical protein